MISRTGCIRDSLARILNRDLLRHAEGVPDRKSLAHFGDPLRHAEGARRIASRWLVCYAGIMARLGPNRGGLSALLMMYDAAN
jgi:hypothetical protein